MYHNPCKFMYLEQDENNSIFSYLPLAIFYSSLGYYAIKFINYLQNENREMEIKEEEMRSNYKYQRNCFLEKQLLEKQDLGNPARKVSAKNSVEESSTNTVNNIKDEGLKPLSSFGAAFTKAAFTKAAFDNMLSSKSLERALVVYYIFVKKGNYKVKTDNEELFEQYNSYLEFNKYDDYYSVKQQLTDLDDPEHIHIPYEVNKLFNLDDSLDANKKFFIDEKEYNINEGHYNMITWLCHSGLYEYLTTNLEVKKKILKEMYENNLLTGNLFLRYQLQLL